MVKLEVVPITLGEANAFVTEHHPHNKAVRGHKFSIAVAGATMIHGVVIISRPIARLSRRRDDARGCSMLLGWDEERMFNALRRGALPSRLVIAS